MNIFRAEGLLPLRAPTLAPPLPPPFAQSQLLVDRGPCHRQRKKKIEREYSITRRPAQFLLLPEENLPVST